MNFLNKEKGEIINSLEVGKVKGFLHCNKCGRSFEDTYLWESWPIYIMYGGEASFERTLHACTDCCPDSSKAMKYFYNHKYNKHYSWTYDRRIKK